MSYSLLRQFRVTLLVLAAVASALPAAAELDFYSVTPCRVYDSRGNGGPLNQGTTYTVTIAGACGVPADAVAVALNVTVVGATGSGELAVFPAGMVAPFVGVLPFKAGRDQAIIQMVSLGTGVDSGKLSFRATIPSPPPSPTYQFIIDVSGYYLNAPPTLTAGGTLSYIENDPPTAIDTTITVADTDDTDLQSATVQITGNYVNGEDVLSFVNTANITGVFTPANGTLTLTGADTLANWQTALRSVLYANTSDSPSTAARTVTWIVNDGTSDSTPDPDTSTINITATNDAPAGTDGTVSTPEDTDYVFAAADFGFTDPLDSPANALLAVKITTLPALGSLTLSGGAVTAGQSIAVADITGGNLKFTPAANGNGSPYTTFTFQVQDDGGTANGGVDLDASPNTLTVNVTGVNNPPAGTDGGVSTPEDTQYTFAAADFGFTDPLDTPANSLASVVITTLPGLGSLTLSGSPFAAGTEIAVADINAGNLKYSPVADAAGSPYTTFTFQVRDDGGTAGGGVDLDASANTLTINVTGVNDAPAGADNTVSTSEDVQYTFAAADFGFSDPIDSPANALQAVKITTLPAAGTLTLSGSGFVAGTDIAVADITAGNLKFTPAANASGSPYTTFTFQVRDDGGTVSGGVDLDPTPNTMTVNVTAVNDAPAGTNNAVNTLEETQYTFTAADFGFTDPNDSPANALASVVITTLPGVGTLTLSGGGFAAGTEISLANITAGNLKFTPAGNGSGSPYTTFTFQVRDDGGTANGGVDLDPSANTMTVNVAAVNDAPAGTNNTVAALEDAQYTFTVADFAFTDPNDSPANALASVVITTLPGAGTLTLSGSGFAAGTEISVADITAGNLKFTPAANGSGSPYTTFTFQVRDDGGTANGGVDLDASPNTMTVNVAPVNDAPAGTNNTVTTDEDVPYTFTAADFGFTDPNDSPANALASVVITTLPGAGSLTLSNVGFAAGTEISLANITGGNLKFLGAANAFGSPYASFTFQVRDNGGTASGGVDLDPTPNTMTINVLPVNDAPTFADATIDYSTVGNTQLRAGEAATGASVLHIADNLDVAEKSTPSDIDGPAPPFLYSLGVAPLNGQATVNSNGTFTYEPNPGFAGPTDSFTVNVSDGGVPAGVSAVTVTVTISEMVWYVHDVTGANNPALGDDGRSTNAFEVLQDAINAAGQDDYVFVFRGNTGTTPHAPATLTNKDGLKLHGEGFGLSVPGFPGLIAAGSRAVVQNAAATGAEDNALQVTINAGTVDGVEIRGLEITATDNAIDVTVTGAATAGVTISHNGIGTGTLEGIDVNHGSTSTTSTLAVHDNVLLTGGNAIDVTRTAGTLKITAFDDNVVSGDTTASGIVVTGPNISFDSVPGTAALDAVSGGNTFIGASGNPVASTGLALSQVSGSLSFTDLDIFAGGTSGAGLIVGGTGAFTGVAGTNVQVTPAAPDDIGTSTIDSDNGPAVDITSATIDLRLADLDSNTSTAGLSLNTVGGQLRAPSGSAISKTSGGGTAFSVASSSATVNYAGTLNVTSGSGVSLTSNSGATNFSGTLTLNTGANPAFAATGGGTVTATDTASTLTTTTATALNVANTTIGAADLTFRNISSTGGGNSGIVLNNTGGVGGLTVVGNGGACTSAATCTGGAIINKTVDAVSLTNTRDVSLTRMFIDNSDNSGIRGDDLTNFTLANSIVTNNANVADGTEANLRFFDLLGTSSITNSTITGGFEDQIRISPFDSTGTLSISGSDIGNTVNAAGNGITIATSAGGDGNNDANFTLNVTTSTIHNIASTGIAAGGDDDFKRTVNVTSSDFTDNNTAIHLLGSEDADMTFNIDDNDFLRHGLNPIQIVSGSTSTNQLQWVGKVNNNRIGDGTANSGATDLHGIAVEFNGDVQAIVSITNNQVKNTDIDGIFVQTRLDNDADAETGRLDLTLRDNDVDTPDDNSAFPFFFAYGTRVEARNTTTICLDMAGNSSAGVGGAEHFQLRQRDTATFRLERLTDGDGTPNELITNMATVEAHIVGQNDAGSTADATQQNAATGFTETADGFCQTPP